MSKLTTKAISSLILLASVAQAANLSADLSSHNNPKCTHSLETVVVADKNTLSTDAGDINFDLIKVHTDNNPLAFQKVDKISVEDRIISLSNGSVWKVSNVDAVRGWEKYKNLVITQNHATFSSHKFALVNLDLGLAEPISLLTPPTPHKDNLFVKRIDATHDIVVLSNDKDFSVHTRDHGILKKFNVNGPVLLGINTMDQDTSNPYIIVDVSLNSHGYVRAAANPIKK